MANYRTVMNRVLRLLGEDEIGDGQTELESDYHKLVGVFMNQIKEEIEDSHNWRSLRNNPQATIQADALSSTLGVPNNSRLLRIHNPHTGVLLPVAVDLTNADLPLPIQEADLAEIIRMDLLHPTVRASGAPQYFALDATDDGNIHVHVWPRPSEARIIRVHVVRPQDRLEDDDLDTRILIPERPLEIGTIWYALEERGEELGPDSRFSERKYREALDSAIARDTAEAGGIDLVIV